MSQQTYQFDTYEEMLVNETTKENDSTYMDSYYIIKEILMLTLSLIGITLNVSIAISIMKFKKMRNRLNIVICNICILNIICYIINFDTYFAFRHIFHITYNIPLIILLYKTLISLITGSTIFLFMISLNRTFRTCTRKTFHIILIITWSFIILSLIANLMFYVIGLDYNVFLDVLIFISFNLFILCRFIIYIKDVYYKNITEYYNFRQAICLTNIITIIISTLSYIMLRKIPEESIILFTIFDLLLEAYFCQPIWFVYVLTKHDKNLKICLCNMLRCKYDKIKSNVEYNDVDIEIGSTAP